MDIRTKKVYERLQIDVSKEEMDDSDVVIFLKSIYGENINYNNESFVYRMISLVEDRSYPSQAYIVRQFRTAIKTKNPTQIKYWLERGWDQEESKLKQHEQMKLRTSNICVEYWTKKGFDEHDAREKISREQSKRSKKGYDERDISYRRKKSRMCVEYWLSRGYHLKEAKEQISELAKRITSFYTPLPPEKRNTRIEYYLSRGHDKEDAERILKQRQATMGLWKDNKYTEYANTVRKISNDWCDRGKVINHHLRGKDYHLDHVFSISHGFLKGIPEEVIGHWTNLCVIESHENWAKSYRSNKTEKQLWEDYEKYEGTNKDHSNKEN